MAKRLRRHQKPFGTNLRSNESLRFETLESRQLLTTFFVDGGTGDDGADGLTLGTPFKTIQAAANLAQSGDTVLIRGGVYREEVDIPRSGTSAAPIVFSAYQNEEVVVSGADLVTGWALDPSQGANTWVATANWNAGGNRDNNTLFVDGELKFEARQWAENDPMNIDDWGLVRQGRLDDFATGFRDEDLTSFPNDFWNGAKVKFHTNDFTFNTKTIADFNGSNGFITFDSAVDITTQKQDGGYYIYDTINALDQAGEWFKDTGNNLYYQAEPGQNPNNLDIEFKRRDYGFEVRGRDNIHIQGLTFRGVSIDTDGNTDRNVYQGNTFYATDKGNYGRFFINGDNNTFRDNEVHDTWGAVATIGGNGNNVVNNYFRNIGMDGKSHVFSATGADALLISHNTAITFARSFLNGYPLRSEIAYNVFEDGGNLSWDTGVFDADGGNGDSSYSIFHHNVFRNNSDSRGIYEAFYGRNNNAVVHHNLFYDFENSSRPTFRAAGTEFRQSYHNTIITDYDSSPEGQLEARNAIGTRYNNNIQYTLEFMEALGVDVRGNHDFALNFSDFNNPAAGDYTLAPGSDAIDAGIVIPGINEDFLGEAPDAGAFESGRAPWVAGHNFATPPNPVYSWTALPGTNLFDNGQFQEGIDDWTIEAGSPNSRDRNSWNLQQSGAPLTGTFRTESVEFTPNEAISRSFTGLQPNTTYTLGAAVRVANRLADAGDYTRSSGSVTTATHRGEEYVTGLAAGQWARINNVDFGDPGQYDRLEALHITDPSNFGSSIDGVGIEVRLDSPTGELIADFDQLNDGNTEDRWRADTISLSEFSGGRVRDVYISVTGGNATNLAVGSFRLLKNGAPADDLLTVNISSVGAPSQTARLGAESWQLGYDEVVFTTGPSATGAVVEFENRGRLNAYLDRLFLIEGYATRGAEPVDISTGVLAYRSVGPDSRELDFNLTDGSSTSESVSGNHAGSWVQVDLGNAQKLYSLELTAPSVPEQMTNFRVSVWSADPDGGGTQVWSQDYLTDGQLLSAGEVLQVSADTFGLDGETKLGDAKGRFVRVELIGNNAQGGQALALGELKVMGFDLSNLAKTDGSVTQSTTAGGFSADLAIDNDPSTYSETDASATGSWWQTRFAQPFSIGRIELENRDDSSFSDLSHFTVYVLDEVDGSVLWQKEYFTTGSVGQGENFLIDGSEVSDTSTRRLASVHTGRVVRVELTGPGGQNNNGNGRLSLANVRIAASDTAPPLANVAQQRGIAEQSNDFYGDASIYSLQGFAPVANDGAIFPGDNFTSTLSESQAWWQVDLREATEIEQIVVYNRRDAASRLNNFRVTLWDNDPENGGSELWGRTYNYSSGVGDYSTGTTIGPGGALIIDGNDTDGGLRLDSVDGARYVRVQLNGTNILSLAEVQVWTEAENVALDPTQTAWNLDLGTPTSPVQGGWIGVTPNSYGDAWWNGQPSSQNQPSVSANSINRDFVTSTEPATLNARVPNGVYEVTVNMGDGIGSRDNMMLWAESQLISDDIDSPTGQYSYVDENGASPTPTSFEVVVRDGELNVRFDDGGDVVGAASGWAINRLTLNRIGDLPPGPENALQLVVDSSGGALLKNQTGEAMSLVGYTITSDQNALVPSRWVGLGQQQYDNAGWTESSATPGLIAESGSTIEIPNGGQVYLGIVLDTSASQEAALQFQLEGGALMEGFVAAANLELPRLMGDFNDDLRVDAADYTIWRDRFGDTVAPFESSDANGDGRINQSDKPFWQTRYGDEVSVASLIDATTGNGSFEDWGVQDAATRILVNSGIATVPGWTVETFGGNGGWLRQGDAAATAGASSDGIAYAIGTGGTTVEATSAPLGHVTTEGEEFVVSLDVGSRDGSDNTYEVALLFGGQERSLGTIVDGPNATTEGLSTHEFSYVATAFDAGLDPTLKITLINSNLSLAFFDNVRVRAVGGSASSTAIAMATGSSLVSYSGPPQASTPSEPNQASQTDLAFLLGIDEDTAEDEAPLARAAALSATEYTMSDTLLIDSDKFDDRYEAERVEETAETSGERLDREASDEAFLAF